MLDLRGSDPLRLNIFDVVIKYLNYIKDDIGKNINKYLDVE